MGMFIHVCLTRLLINHLSFIASTIPAWQAECLKTQRRGTLLLVSFGGCITLGLALSYWLSFAFSWIHSDSVSWRFPVAFSIAILLPALITIVFMPESPRYLLLCGREKEALNVLSALEELPADHEDVRREVLLIKNTVLRLASGGSSFSGLFTMGKERHLHRVILAVALQLMAQFTGVSISATICYSIGPF
jgi:MFS family permease